MNDLERVNQMPENIIKFFENQDLRNELDRKDRQINSLKRKLLYTEIMVAIAVLAYIVRVFIL